jgi:hypothetical protein
MSEAILSQELATFGISLHQAILDKLVKEIKEAIAGGEIRSKDDQHSVYDFCRIKLSATNPSLYYKRLTASVPAVLTFCYNLQFAGAGQKDTPVANLAGLIYIAYIGSGDFSCQLRASSAALLAASATPIAIAPQSEVDAVAQARQDHETYPISIDELQRTTQIVNKSQIKSAITRDLILERDYTEIDGKIFMTIDIYHILSMSFRSLSGTDITRLPEVLRIQTIEYFRIQNQRRMNARLGKRDHSCEGQLNLPVPGI